LTAELGALVRRRSLVDFPPAELKTAVRDLLRTERFKPSGRSKPASEYLAQAARENRFPFINNLVDINNYISLLSGLPASLLDLTVLGDELVIRYGRENERYVFNSTGQHIDLDGLICVCSAAGTPFGNPVKDSLAGKITDNTTSVIGIVFAPQSIMTDNEVTLLADRFANLLQTYASAGAVECAVLLGEQGGTHGH
jgi:DNA/RNA-binding domain of Phe-tRNA-synthetase-like protein